ncbi:MAG: hypothetical protein J6Y53_04790 [Alphaproteobacteria bacterium]|nr:hypothetical protein [Alphaproteobacteria bacterium]
MEKAKKLATIATCCVSATAIICLLFVLLGLFYTQEGGINTSFLSWTILGCTALFVVVLYIDIYLYSRGDVSFYLVFFSFLLVISGFVAFGFLDLIGTHPMFWLSCGATSLMAMVCLLYNAHAAL